MKCYSPLYVKGNTVPCGRCVCCRQLRAMDWAFRLVNELKYSSNALFVTLTLRFIPQEGVNKRHLQMFFKRVRKSLPKGVRYFACGEYGERTKRPHYHAIIFNANVDAVVAAWKLGHVHVGAVSEDSIGYVTGYTLKASDYPKNMQKPFALMSRRPPLGHKYLETHKSWHRGNQLHDKLSDIQFDYFRPFTFVNGVRGHLPRFYRDRFFTKLERQAMMPLQIAKMDRLHNIELERLSQFHSSPEQYMLEKQVINSQKILTKKIQYETI